MLHKLHTLRSRILPVRKVNYSWRIIDYLHHLQGIETIHFLHVSKTGGTVLKSSLRPYLFLEKRYIRLHPHSTTLADIPEGEKVIFFLRDPIKRFVSGFYSRLREGEPAHHSKWNQAERKAFMEFSTPNLLAEALSSDCSETHNMAIFAMQNIGHINTLYSFWLLSEAYLARRKEDVFFFGFQETLVQDFHMLKLLLSLPSECELDTRPTVSHQAPDNEDKHLSELAIHNLRHWYREDYSLLKFLQRVRNEILFVG